MLPQKWWSCQVLGSSWNRNALSPQNSFGSEDAFVMAGGSNSFTTNAIVKVDGSHNSGSCFTTGIVGTATKNKTETLLKNVYIFSNYSFSIFFPCLKQVTSNFFGLQPSICKSLMPVSPFIAGLWNMKRLQKTKLINALRQDQRYVISTHQPTKINRRIKSLF